MTLMTDIRDICRDYILSLDEEQFELIWKHYKNKIRTKPKDVEDFWNRLSKNLKTDEDERELAQIISLCCDDKNIREMFRNLCEDASENEDDEDEESTDSDNVDEEPTDDELEEEDDF